MQTATRLTAAEAAKETGVSKSTILRALESGKISGTKEPETGKWHVEPIELFRTFPATRRDADARHGTDGDTARIAENRDDTPISDAMQGDASNDATRRSSASYVERLKGELEALKREANTQREERERERQQQSETVQDLRTRLDASEEERRKTTTQLTALLTDQREPAKKGLFGFLKRASA